MIKDDKTLKRIKTLKLELSRKPNAKRVSDTFYHKEREYEVVYIATKGFRILKGKKRINNV